MRVGIDDRFNRFDNIHAEECRPDNIADADISPRIAAEGDLAIFLTFPVDAENADMADVIVTPAALSLASTFSVMEVEQTLPRNGSRCDLSVGIVASGGGKYNTDAVKVVRSILS